MLDADRLIVLEYPFTTRTTKRTNRVSGWPATSSLSAKRASKICHSFATVCLHSSSNLLLLLFLFAQSCSSLASSFLPMIDCKAQIQFIKPDSQCSSAATSAAVRPLPANAGRRRRRRRRRQPYQTLWTQNRLTGRIRHAFGAGQPAI